MEKKDRRFLAIAWREIVAAQSCFHMTGYECYTRAEASPTGALHGCGELLEVEYTNLKSEAYQTLFDYIRSDVLANENVVRLTDMTELLLSFVSHVCGCWRDHTTHKEAH